MNSNIIVVDDKKYFEIFSDINARIITPEEYLIDESFKKEKSLRVFNLSNSFSYQGIGYYISLLALARKHKIHPDPMLIQDLKTQTMHKILSSDIDELIQKTLSKLKTEEFELSIYFGKNVAKTYDDLAKKFSSIINAPLFRVKFYFDKKWEVDSIKLLSLSQIDPLHIEFIREEAKIYFEHKISSSKTTKKSIYDLAILHNPEDKSSPSNARALEKFVHAGKQIGIRVDLLTKKDLHHVMEYDALFIRETTNVNHHTYRIARKAQAEGLIVIDDPESILKCTNKVFLEEILDRAQLNRPKSHILIEKNFEKIQMDLTFPCVIKRPDSAFSQGVYKVSNVDEYLKLCKELFKTSDLLLSQEFISTDFDWRVGVLNNEILFVCKYFMAKGHWQIIDHAGEEVNYGNFETINPYMVPEKIIKTARKASSLIGKGLYGLDLKEVNGKVYVIEINDNPNLDAGVEDKILGNQLYLKIMEHFMFLLNKQRRLI